MVHGLPQAAPRDEQHWDFKVAPLMLISHRPPMTVCQHVPLMVSLWEVEEEGQIVFNGDLIDSVSKNSSTHTGIAVGIAYYVRNKDCF